MKTFPHRYSPTIWIPTLSTKAPHIDDDKDGQYYTV